MFIENFQQGKLIYCPSGIYWRDHHINISNFGEEAFDWADMKTLFEEDFHLKYEM